MKKGVLTNKEKEAIWVREIHPLRLISEEKGKFLFFPEVNNLLQLRDSYHWSAEDRICRMDSSNLIRSWWYTALVNRETYEGIVIGVLTAANTEVAITTKSSSKNIDL
jgi:hypothetical protein